MTQKPMVLYFLLFIPIITAIVLYLFFERKMLWWEFTIPFGVSVVLVILLKWGVEKYEVSYPEYWGSFVDRVEYYEEWDEWVHQTCTETCCCDSKGQHCRTRTYDCSHRVYHPPYWMLYNTIGESVSISREEYSRIKAKLGNEGFVNMHRSYYTIDGDMYRSKWRGDSLSSIPVTTEHTYENRVKASDATVFHFRDLEDADVKRYDLKEYPKITDAYKMDAVIGDNSADAIVANQKFKHLNASLGPTKEVCIFVLVFKNQPLEAAFKQEAYWKGANMNEFVVCIGIDEDRTVQWGKVISWTENELLKQNVRSIIDQQTTLDLSGLADKMGPLMQEFKRRDFKEFDYLTVEPSWWAIIGSAFLVLLVNFLISAWVVGNEHEEDSSSWRRGYSRGH